MVGSADKRVPLAQPPWRARLAFLDATDASPGSKLCLAEASGAPGKNPSLQLQIDRAEISDCQFAVCNRPRYARSEVFRSCFADEIEAAHVSSVFDSEGRIEQTHPQTRQVNPFFAPTSARGIRGSGEEGRSLVVTLNLDKPIGLAPI
jgi:hypothetical protein